jgi:thioredoxin-related protein
MGVIKLFIQSRCARCPQAKQVGIELSQEGYQVVEYDVGTADGLAEASFYSVQATPTFILEDKHEKTVADFRGVVPTVQQIKEIMCNA